MWSDFLKDQNTQTSMFLLEIIVIHGFMVHLIPQVELLPYLKLVKYSGNEFILMLVLMLVLNSKLEIPLVLNFFKVQWNTDQRDQLYFVVGEVKNMVWLVVKNLLKEKIYEPTYSIRIIYSWRSISKLFL